MGHDAVARGARAHAHREGGVGPHEGGEVHGHRTHGAHDEIGRRLDDVVDGNGPLVLLVGKVSARASRDLLTAYLDGSGPRSIKAVVEPGPHTAFHSVRVTEAEEPEPVSVAGVEHLACILSLDVVGGN